MYHLFIHVLAPLLICFACVSMLVNMRDRWTAKRHFNRNGDTTIFTHHGMRVGLDGSITGTSSPMPDRIASDD